MIIKDKIFTTGTHIMAIINLSPDSFNKDSRFNKDNILFGVENAIKYGAEIIDIGGQSTRPNHTIISPLEELDRIIAPIELIKNNFDIPISVDTYYPSVAEEVLKIGVDLINDIWGLQYNDKSMAKTCAKYNAAVCIMHNKQDNKYKNFFNDILNFLSSGIKLAKEANIPDEKIIIDGGIGIGFGKDTQQNWELLNNYEKLKVLGYPLLLGTSRKSMFGGNVEDRLQKTLESTKLAVQKNILFVRVHDIKENMLVIKEEYAKLH